MAKKRLAKVCVRRSKTGQYYVRIVKNGRTIFHSENYKNLFHAEKIAAWIKGDREDIELVRFKVK